MLPNKHRGISWQRVAGLPPLLELRLPIVVAARTASAVHADLMVALDLNIVAGLGKEKAIPLGAARPTGLTFQKRSFGAFSPFS